MRQKTINRPLSIAWQGPLSLGRRLILRRSVSTGISAATCAPVTAFANSPRRSWPTRRRSSQERDANLRYTETEICRGSTRHWSKCRSAGDPSAGRMC